MICVESQPDKLEAAVHAALGDVGDGDRGAAQLALAYARQIDGGGDLDKLGPQLLAVLDALLLTPKARAALVKGAKDERPPQSPLDELRKRRAARQRDTAPVDTPAS